MKKKFLMMFLTAAIMTTSGFVFPVQASTGSGRFRSSAISDEKYTSGQYKVGEDIPAGEYMLFASGGTGYFAVTSDSNGNDIVVNDNFDYDSIISISDGQYLELSRCYAAPIDKVDVSEVKLDKSGSMYKVGLHIPAGEYKLNANSSGKGYYCIYNSSTQQNIVSNNNFEGSQYVTVTDGQYLVLERCTFDSIPKMVYTDTETVKKVQERLNELGYDCGTADGVSGQKTIDAITKFETDKGITVDGQITVDLLDALEENTVSDSASVEEELTVDVLRDRISKVLEDKQPVLSEAITINNDNSKDIAMFSVKTKDYGTLVVTAWIDDSTDCINPVVVSLEDATGEQASVYLTYLAKMICAMDGSLSEEEALSIVNSSTKAEVEKNGFSYFLDMEEPVSLLVTIE